MFKLDLLLKKKHSTIKTNWGLYIVLVLLIIVASQLNPRFLSSRNIFNVLRQASALGMLTLGSSFVILTGNGGVDLSIASTASMAACFTAGIMMGQPENLITAMLVALAIGILIGLINGLFVTKIGTEPFISTLGMMIVVQGVNMIYTQGAPLGSVTAGFRMIGRGFVGPIPIPVIIFVGSFLIASLILKRTIYGRYLYALGGNEEATRLSGINTDLLKISVYVIAAVTAVIGGWIMLARVGTGEPHLATGAELEAIAATIIGGITFVGGVGTVLGAFAGVMILSIMNNLLNLMNVDPFIQLLIRGLIILGAISFQRFRSRDFLALLKRD